MLHIHGHELLEGTMFSNGRLPIEDLPVPFPIKLENQESHYRVKLKNLKTFLSKNKDKLFAIPITYTAQPIGNNVESFLKDFSKNLIEFDNVHIVFHNGQDIYGDNIHNNFDRDQYIADSLLHFPKSRIHFYLCNVENLNRIHSKMPDANLNFYNIYFSQMAHTIPDIKHLKYTSEKRKFNVISLNSRQVEHRDNIVSILEQYETALYSYRYKNKFLENTAWDKNIKTHVKDPTAGYNIPQPHSLMRQYQNVIPEYIYNNAYFYICTETNFYISNHIEEKEHRFNKAWFTEKTLKSFVYKWPMLIVGNPYTLKALRTIGFETFPEIFDETYDEIEDPDARMDNITKQIITLCNMSTVQAHEVYHTNIVQEKLEYNKNHFFTLLNTMDINKLSIDLLSVYRV
jgi:hypothetical protein